MRSRSRKCDYCGTNLASEFDEMNDGTRMCTECYDEQYGEGDYSGTGQTVDPEEFNEGDNRTEFNVLSPNEVASSND
ncbi:hypothetical protein SEA_SIENNA_81 [Gordonia phage Sienna]|uniref:Uncharacterized protein n=1 Tax=Gordonia phage Sienna TaxID=2759396 RepID=A0A7L7SIV3_9CAUD|nr:hypothetical protein SEA_SIENNA_81 [Gordonia phage Sienna]